MLQLTERISCLHLEMIICHADVDIFSVVFFG